MIRHIARVATVALGLGMASAWATCPYDANCLNNPYGAESPYNPDSPNNQYGAGNPYGAPLLVQPQGDD